MIDPITIEQRHRDACADYLLLTRHVTKRDAQAIRDGKWDDTPHVRFFAERDHMPRPTDTARAGEGERDAFDRGWEACERKWNGPSAAGYPTDIDAAWELDQIGRPSLASVSQRVGECTGCGSTETIEQIRAKNPKALSCCPERDMRQRIYRLPVIRRYDYSGEHREWTENVVLPQQLVDEIQRDALTATPSPVTDETALSGEDRPDFSFHRVLREMRNGMTAHKWWRKVDGTPAQNDLPVIAANIAIRLLQEQHNG